MLTARCRTARTESEEGSETGIRKRNYLAVPRPRCGTDGRVGRVTVDKMNSVQESVAWLTLAIG